MDVYLARAAIAFDSPADRGGLGIFDLQIEQDGPDFRLVAREWHERYCAAAVVL